MKIRLGQLRSLIREEFLQGVPEWQFREDVSDFVERVRDRITRYVLVNHSLTGVDRQEAVAAMNAVCEELEEKVYSVLEDQLFAFTRKV